MECATPSGGPGFCSPAEAIRSGGREQLLYTVCYYAESAVEAPDYLATVCTDPGSPEYSRVVHRLNMPGFGDELHHFGWNACSSCHCDPAAERRYLVLLGLRSGSIHFADVKTDPRAPRLASSLTGEAIEAATGLAGPHEAHCLRSEIIVAMCGNGPADSGLLIINQQLQIVTSLPHTAHRPELDVKYIYSFWYQPRLNLMVSTSACGLATMLAPPRESQVLGSGLKAMCGCCGQGTYGSKLAVWDLERKAVTQSVPLGFSGLAPLELRMLHQPDGPHGYFGAGGGTLSHFEFSPEAGLRTRVFAGHGAVVSRSCGCRLLPNLVSDVLISMDDQWLYAALWFAGELHQYNIADPARPVHTATLKIGGVGCSGQEEPDRQAAQMLNGRRTPGGPGMTQLSLDGSRLYFCCSLLAAWEKSEYPEMVEQGGAIMMVDCDTGPAGGMKLNQRFCVDLYFEPSGPSRSHMIRFPEGDCTSDIWT